MNIKFKMPKFGRNLTGGGTFGRSDDPTKDRVTHVYLSRVK